MELRRLFERGMEKLIGNVENNKYTRNYFVRQPLFVTVTAIARNHPLWFAADSIVAAALDVEHMEFVAYLRFPWNRDEGMGSLKLNL